MTVNIQTGPSLDSNDYRAALSRNGSAAISVDDPDERKQEGMSAFLEKRAPSFVGA